jgi:hypothetical protein
MLTEKEYIEFEIVLGNFLAENKDLSGDENVCIFFEAALNYLKKGEKPVWTEKE